ncbi:MAG: class I SAM-dependent methyltransferase [Acidimicrobiia bacterium]|nr:class I SAM-dependent methyltransferase [Acidimicrobiia bacterium]MCL4292873.1 class I SAM-dependent methyltransferase [Acidimicrobiia bacterium]
MTTAEPASFRDPDTAVFYQDGRVLRGLSEQGKADWDRLAATKFLGELVAAGKVVRTTPFEGGAPLSPRGAPWAAVIEHERIPVISYPFEWPFALLKQAAVLHLEVLLAALGEGISMKDGYAYNVQFRGVAPTFIDLGSFEPAKGPWPGYRQFCQTLLFPLMIQAHLGIAYQSYLRGSVNGLEPGDVRGMFGGLRRFKKGVFRNVYLHSVLEKKVTTSTEQVKSQLKQAGFGLELAKATAGKLLKLVHKLDVKKRGSTWSDYRETCSYSDADASAKQAFVDGVAGAMAPGTVLDLGANDGEYSLIAARHAQQVIAVDADEPTIDAFARRLLAGGPGNVLPLVMDLVDPSPGIGWRNRERAPFPERVRPDLVFSLALVHHLAISANVPLPEVVGWLRSFDAPAVVEFVDRDDPMTKRLLANKPAGLFDDYRLDAFEKLLGEQFSLDKRELLPSGTRTLFLATPR